MSGDYWDRICDWLKAVPRPQRSGPAFHMTFLGFKEVPGMGNKLRGTLAFSSLPKGYEKEIVARQIDLFVNDAQVASENLPVTIPTFEFDVEQDDHVRLEYRYRDDNGHLSVQAQTLDFIAVDNVPPPSPTDGTLSFTEVLDESGGTTEEPGETEPGETEPGENAPSEPDPETSESDPPAKVFESQADSGIVD